jgi:hypothetical protein
MSAGGIHTPSQDLASGPDRRRANNALKGGTIEQDVQSFQNLFLPYDQLLAMGRVNPTSAPLFKGLSGNQSVLGNLLASYQDQLAQADPAYASLRGAMANNLNLGESGLPQDVEQRITKNVRAAQASRGLIDSSSSAIEEAGALAGGAEQIRVQRTAELNDFFSRTTQSAIDRLFPSLSGLYQGELDRAVSRSQAGTANAGKISASI